MRFNFTLEQKKKYLVLATTLVWSLSAVSCDASKFMNDNDNSSVSESVSIEDTYDNVTSDTTISIDTSDLTETTPETTYINNVGEIYVREQKYLTREEYLAIMYRTADYGFTSLGVDNPVILEEARRYFKDKSLTLEDVAYFQSDAFGDADYDIIPVRDRMQQLKNGYAYYFEIARYVLSLYGEKPLIGQDFGKAFFTTYFPEYTEMCDKKKARELSENMRKNNPYFYDLEVKCAESGESALKEFISSHPSDPEAQEAVKYELFMLFREYNDCRRDLAGSYSTIISFMPIVRTTNDELVLYPSSGTFDKIQAQFSTVPKCENLDFSRPETYDDLLNSGVDVEFIEQTFEYAGLDIPKLSEQLDQSSGKQKSRG